MTINHTMRNIIKVYFTYFKLVIWEQRGAEVMYYYKGKHELTGECLNSQDHTNIVTIVQMHSLHIIPSMDQSCHMFERLHVLSHFCA